MGIRILTGILSLILLAGTGWAQPAFLDGFDEIRAYVGPTPVSVSELRGKLRASLDGKPILLKGVTGAELAPFPADPNMVSLPGTLSGATWDPANPATKMVKVGEGVYELVLKLEKGRYEYKLARGGTWAENYGAGFTATGGNMVLEVPETQLVRFVVDFNLKVIENSIEHSATISKPTQLPPALPTAQSKFVSVSIKLAKPLRPEDVRRPIWLRIGDQKVRPVVPREVLSAPAFRYAGDDLGPTWTKTATTFKVWSPISTRATLKIGNPARRVAMQLGTNGVWYAKLPGDLHGARYQYEFQSLGQTRVAADVYAKSASADSAFSVVVDMARTQPAGWPAPRLFQGKQHTDAVLYEAHVRDLTVDPNSGVKPEWRGKHLGLTQAGTRGPDGKTLTGLDYLASLGITHLHLLPFQDFNPGNSAVYNWGYETTLFNVPEEQYVVAKNDSVARIRETKQMILALQKRSIGVVLDVVYNHSVPSEGPGSAFWQTVPYYYFRTNDRGDVLNESGVGNALHDERPMVRKFIRDSLMFWAKEYRLDGFRFDLIGMFTRESNLDLARAIHKVNPSAVVYGEPWTGGGPLRFGKGDQRGTGVAVFNDRFRGVFRGELDGAGPGFPMGASTPLESLIRVISGSVTDFADSPQETVNYVSAHDNLSFADKISLSLPDTGDGGKERAMRFAHAAVLFSQGMPFIEGGVELGRTKGMNNNTYNAGDAANQYDWRRAMAFQDRAKYFRGLIAVRQAHPAFRLQTKNEIQRHMTFTDPALLPANVISYRIAEPGGSVLVYLNGRRSPARVTLPSGEWDVLVHDDQAGVKSMGKASGALVIPELSASVLFLPND